jgi:hypothetical protein
VTDPVRDRSPRAANSASRPIMVLLGMAMLVIVMVASALILRTALMSDDHCPEGTEPSIRQGDQGVAHATLRCVPAE